MRRILNRKAASPVAYNVSGIARAYSTTPAVLAEDNLTGGQLVHASLVECGVTHIFGYSGGANLPVLDAFHTSPIRFIKNQSEQCCGHAAEGFAKSTGKTGVILTTSGPGLTNIITPLQDAKGDSVPLVAFSGQVPTAAMGTDAFQECASVDITRPCTKWSYQVQSVEEVRAVVHEAFAVSQSGKKGPVHIDLPKDVMVALLNENMESLPVLSSDGQEVSPMPGSPSHRSMMAAVESVADLLSVSKKPVIYAGQGVMEACPELKELAELQDIPVTTTLHAMGCFDERHPLSLHMLGMHGSAYANLTIQNADLILAIGSRFDDRTTGTLSSYAPEARKAEAEGRGGIVHFDIDKSQFGRVISPTVSVHGDCKNTLKSLLALLRERGASKRPEWAEQYRGWKTKHPFEFNPAKDGQIKTQSVIEAIYNEVEKRKVGDNTFICTGVGNHQMMSCQYYRWVKPRSIVTSGSLGTMGFGLPSAIGVQLGNPDANVILIDGDGSFNMTSNDLGTMMEYKLPVKIALMNDGRQQMVHVWQKLFFDGRIVATNNVNPDYVALARAYGFQSETVRTQADLPGAVERFLDAEGPVLFDFRTIPDICLPMVAPGKGLHEMILPKTLDIEGDGIKMDGMAPN